MASELLGVAELSRKLDQLSEKVRGSTLRKAANAAVKPVIADAKSRIPVNAEDRLHWTYKGRQVAPGFAQRSIKAKVSLSQDRRAVFAAIGVKREAFYAINFVELEIGSSKRKKTPWLVPAFESTRGQQLARFAEILKAQIMKVAAGGK
jgi:HK97 gp10 family phage protein